MSLELKVKVLTVGAKVPTRETPGAAGMDIRSVESISIYPGKTVLIGTGLAFEVPEGYELQVRPRSGLSAKTDLRIANSPGTIDSDYRGEVKIIMSNVSMARSFKVNAGDRIAQLVLAKVPQCDIIEVQELGDTKRGEAGFGSTGAS